MIHQRYVRQSLAGIIWFVFTAISLVHPFLQSGFAEPSPTPAETVANGIPPLEWRLIQSGFVDVSSLDPHIMVDLEWARTQNFIGINAYGPLTRAYLRPSAAEKLARASAILRRRHPNLRLLVTDAVRPRSVQHQLWKLVVGTPKQPYIANPSSGSMHNYGAAVDVTLYDVEQRQRLDMGTPIYFLGPLAQSKLEDGFLRDGSLSAQQVANRHILRAALGDAGWHNLSIEWWHFDAFPRDFVRRNFSIFE